MSARDDQQIRLMQKRVNDLSCTLERYREQGKTTSTMYLRLSTQQRELESQIRVAKFSGAFT